MPRFSLSSFLPAILFFGHVSCENKQLPPFSADTEINRWIEKEMKLWYYWENKLPAPASYEQGPASFFNSLVYTYHAESRPDGDRFSWIQQNADELRSSLSGEAVTYGMEYRIVSIPALEQTVGIILYVLPGSPADLAGLQRGDIFTHVNETPLSNSNYRSLLAGTTEKSLTVVTPENDTILAENGRTLRLSPVRFQEDPVHFYAIINAGENKKAGYLVYHQFFPSSNGTNDRRFDRKLEAVFAEFKKEQINELIIDLRYNSGGYVSSSIHLASLIAGDAAENGIFSIKEYNPRISATLKKSYGEEFFIDRFTSPPQNVGSLINRVFILTSGRTASASELLINGLAPYTSVITVGETTVGKNVGSVTLSDAESRTNWGLQPIVSKSYNSLKQSDYTAGFKPKYAAKEPLKLYPYGDTRDPLLNAALKAIHGNMAEIPNAGQTGGRPDDTTLFTEISTSLSRKTGESMFEDKIPTDFTTSDE